GVKPSEAGVPSALVNPGQLVGGSVGPALLSTIAASATSAFASDKVASPAVMAQAAFHGYTTAFWWSAAIFAVGAIVCAALLPNRVAAVEPRGEPPLAHQSPPNRHRGRPSPPRAGPPFGSRGP